MTETKKDDCSKSGEESPFSRINSHTQLPHRHPDIRQHASHLAVCGRIALG